MKQGWVFSVGTSCGLPPVVKFAKLSMGTENEVIYECDMGYAFSDGNITSTIQCQSDHIWTDVELFCSGECLLQISNNYTAIMCGSP